MLIITFNNQTHNLSEWSRRLNLSYSKLYRLITIYDLTFEQSIEFILSKSKIRFLSNNKGNKYHKSNITYNGKTQKLSIWCKELNLSYSRMKYRLYNLNLSFEDAVESHNEINNIYKTKNDITYNGKTQNLTQWCKELNLSYPRVRRRIKNLNILFEEAIKYDGRESGQYYTFNDKTQLLSEWAKELGVRVGTLQHRLTRLGWPIANVLSKPIRQRDRRKIDMSNGTIFGDLTVLEFEYRNERYYDFYKVKCVCGTIKTVMGQNLRSGLSTSCGCTNGKKWINHVTDEPNQPPIKNDYINARFNARLADDIKQYGKSISSEYELQQPKLNTYTGF